MATLQCRDSVDDRMIIARKPTEVGGVIHFGWYREMSNVYATVTPSRKAFP